MRHGISALVLLALVALPAGAQTQDQTLLGANATHGGFGGPVMRFTRMAGRDAFMMGGRGAYIINGTFAVGGGGYGWNSEHVRGRHGSTAIHELDVGYGGVELEYINRTRQLVHWSAQLMVGGGGASQDRNGPFAVTDDGFFILEPGVNVELNVARGFRLAAGVSYRFINGVELPAFRDADLSGVAGVLTFRFGKF
jgi:hypothetical protein